MIFARVRLVLAALAFVSWLAWLGVAVARKGTVQPVSRAQLTAATLLVVADIAAGPDGQPGTKATVKRVLAGDAAGEIDVTNLPAAATPLPVSGESRTPPAGEYLLALVKDGPGFRIAGLPRTPGQEAVNPPRPVVYPWTADVQAQLRALGLLP